MKDFFYEMIIKTNAIELFKEFAFELGISCIEERENSFIIRDEDDLSDFEFAFLEYKKALENSLKTKINLEISVEKKPNLDWINEYKKGVEPIAVGRFFVRPSWCEKADLKDENGEYLIDIIIDPALAFGSGHHESTNMCLNLISKYADVNSQKTALDVGCGSGILSVALAKLGIKVSSCDTDEQAVYATEQNAKKNGAKIDEIWVGSISNLTNSYDLVVANIIADVILMLQNDLKKSVKKGGILILSGILEKYLDRIKNSFSELNLLEVKQKNEWVSLVFKK